MVYQINIKNDYKVNTLENNGIVKITIPNLDLLLKEDFSELMLENIVRNDEMVNMLHFPEELIESLIKSIKENKNEKELIEHLTSKDHMLFSFSMNIINIYKNKYMALNKMNKNNYITIECNKNNLIEVFEFCKKLDNPILLDTSKITLEEYKILVESYDLDSLDKCNIKIYFQDFNNSLSPKELYETSFYIDTICEEIKKYNLSPIEQIMYAYDVIKRRIYQEDPENSMKCRNLRDVLNSNYIVCVGYTNILNAVLNNLNIKCIPLESEKHLRSMVYVKDKKYNIAGVYVFDPTWDSRKEEETENEYINKYTYFMMPISIAKKYSQIEKIECLSLAYEEIIDTDDISKEKLDKLDDLDELFSLIGISNITDKLIKEDFENNGAKKDYQNGMHKIMKQDINKELLLQIIYNVRRIEYYSGLVTDIDIDGMVEGVAERYHHQKYPKKTGEKLFDVLIIDAARDDLIREIKSRKEETISSATKGHVAPTKDVLNIKLVKTLKKVKIKKEVDNI